MEGILREVKTRRSLNIVSKLYSYIHVHDDIELVYVKEGGGTACCDGRQYALTPGSFFLTFPNQVHHYLGCTGGAYIILIMKPSQLLHLQSFFDGVQPSTPLCGSCPELGALFETAFHEFRENGDSCIVDGYLTVLFGKLLQHYTLEKSSLSPDCIPRLLQYCAGHFREELTVQALSQQMHISCTHISNLFNKRLGISFCDYVSTLRLNEAVKLLENPALSVSEVAGLAGFPTIRTFNRVFRKKYGCSPSDYRKQR